MICTTLLFNYQTKKLLRSTKFIIKLKYKNLRKLLVIQQEYIIYHLF